MEHSILIPADQVRKLKALAHAMRERGDWGGCSSRTMIGMAGPSNTDTLATTRLLQQGSRAFLDALEVNS